MEEQQGYRSSWPGVGRGGIVGEGVVREKEVTTLGDFGMIFVLL